MRLKRQDLGCKLQVKSSTDVALNRWRFMGYIFIGNQSDPKPRWESKEYKGDKLDLYSIVRV